MPQQSTKGNSQKALAPRSSPLASSLAVHALSKPLTPTDDTMRNGASTNASAPHATLGPAAPLHVEVGEPVFRVELGQGRRVETPHKVPNPFWRARGRQCDVQPRLRCV